LSVIMITLSAIFIEAERSRRPRVEPAGDLSRPMTDRG